MDSRDDCRLRAYAAEKQLEELKQENARLREALECVAYFGLDDCAYAAMEMRKAAAAALEEKGDG